MRSRIFLGSSDGRADIARLMWDETNSKMDKPTAAILSRALQKNSPTSSSSSSSCRWGMREASIPKHVSDSTRFLSASCIPCRILGDAVRRFPRCLGNFLFLEWKKFIIQFPIRLSDIASPSRTLHTSSDFEQPKNTHNDHSVSMTMYTASSGS